MPTMHLCLLCNCLCHMYPCPSTPADVDGTLIHSIGKEANKLHKECFTAGFKEVFVLDTNIDVVEHHGSTDPLIVLKVLEHHGIPKEQVRVAFPVCCHNLRSQLDAAGTGHLIARH